MGFWAHHPGGWGGWGWGGWIFGGLATVAFWALLVIAIVLLVRAVGRPRVYGGGPNQPPQSTYQAPPAETILAERFARGEIDEEEFRNRLAALRGYGGPPGS
ncbi:MAG: SHOCT domain-containing protein [Micromonosporaceae bacterium]